MESLIDHFIMLWKYRQFEQVRSIQHIVSAVKTGGDAQCPGHSDVHVPLVQVGVGRLGDCSGRGIHPRLGPGQEVAAPSVVEGVDPDICPAAGAQLDWWAGFSVCQRADSRAPCTVTSSRLYTFIFVEHHIFFTYFMFHLGNLVLRQIVQIERTQGLLLEASEPCPPICELDKIPLHLHCL